MHIASSGSRVERKTGLSCRDDRRYGEEVTGIEGEHDRRREAVRVIAQ